MNQLMELSEGDCWTVLESLMVAAWGPQRVVCPIKGTRGRKYIVYNVSNLCWAASRLRHGV